MENSQVSRVFSQYRRNLTGLLTPLLTYNLACVVPMPSLRGNMYPQKSYVVSKECLCCYCGSELLGEILNVGEETRMFCEHKIQANLLDLVDNQCAHERTFS